MSEKELVEKLKVALREWAGTIKEDLEVEKKTGFKEFKGAARREVEKSYKADVERYEKTVLQIEKATQFKQLTSLVRDWNWDAEAWMHFVFDNAFQSKIEVGDLAGFDT